MDNSVKVYCIIATYNAENWIEKCLNSVVGSSFRCSIVVVDNQSADRTVEIIKSKFPLIKLIQNETNMGFGKANNIGIKWAYVENADYFFLLNQDAWVEPDTIRNLVEKLHDHPEYGILSPLHFFNKEKLDRKFQAYFGKGNELIHHFSSEEKNTIYPVRFVNAAIWLVSRRCIDKVGLFAPIFEHYGEDLNYAHRCKFHNIKIGIYPKAIGYHEREQFPPKENGILFNRLLTRDKNYCFGVLMNLKHSYLRQWLFLLFTGIKEFILSLLVLRIKIAAKLLYRVRFVLLFSELKNQRKEMKREGAFLSEY